MDEAGRVIGTAIFGLAIGWAALLLFPLIFPYWPIILPAAGVAATAYGLRVGVREKGLGKTLLGLGIWVFALGNIAAIVYFFFVDKNLTIAGIATITAAAGAGLLGFLERRDLI